MEKSTPGAVHVPHLKMGPIMITLQVPCFSEEHCAWSTNNIYLRRMKEN